MKIRPINLKEAKEIEKLLIERTEKNLEIISKTIERLKKNPDLDYAVKHYQRRYDEQKRILEECKANPINENDL